jgi:hypothetical protein
VDQAGPRHQLHRCRPFGESPGQPELVEGMPKPIRAFRDIAAELA